MFGFIENRKRSNQQILAFLSESILKFVDRSSTATFVKRNDSLPNEIIKSFRRKVDRKEK